VRLMGVYLKVLGGRPVWPLAFHELVAASDRCALVEQHLEWRDFSPVPLGLRSFGVRHLEELLSGYCNKWGPVWMPADEADCVLAALCLLHMRMKCVIPGSWVAIISRR
jgi:hypothetical protein